MAADIGIEATTSLDEAFAAAMERHGPDAKVIVLPFARYQLPRNAIRMARRATPIPRGAVPGLEASRGSGRPATGRGDDGDEPIRGSTTIVEILRRTPAARPRG